MRNSDGKKFGAILGLVSGVTAILCCVSPVVLVLLGLSSVSAAIALGNHLFTEYKFHFIAASALLFVGGFVWHLRRKGQCSLSGARQHANGLILGLIVAVLTYVVLYHVTTWLGETAQ